MHTKHQRLPLHVRDLHSPTQSTSCFQRLLIRPLETIGMHPGVWLRRTRACIISAIILGILTARLLGLVTYGPGLFWFSQTFTVLVDSLDPRLQDEDIPIGRVAGTEEVVASRKASTPVEGPVLDIRSKNYQILALYARSCVTVVCLPYDSTAGCATVSICTTWDTLDTVAGRSFPASGTKN